MLCSVCKKNTAIIFVNKKDGNDDKLEGFCYNCAKEKGINPLDVLAKQSEILEGDSVNLEDMTSQFESIFKDLADNLSNSDLSLNGMNGTAIPLGAIFGVRSNNEQTTNNSTNSGSTKKVKVDKKVKQKKTKYLDTYGTNLTRKSKK